MPQKKISSLKMHIFNLKICILKLEIVFSCPPETFVTASCPQKRFHGKSICLDLHTMAFAISARQL